MPTRAEITGRRPAATPDRAKRLPGPPCKDPKAIEPSARADLPTSDTVKANPIRGPPVVAAYSIAQFCRSHHISQRLFFKLQAAGRGPKMMQVGRRRLVSIESAQEWRRQMEDGGV